MGATTLAVALVSGCGGSSTASAPKTQTNAAAAYALAVKAPLERLNASAQVTGRVLAHAKSAGDLARVSRSADQQLTVVQQARARIAAVPADGGASGARGDLARATQAHRAFLVTLSRLNSMNADQQRAQIAILRTESRRLLAQYHAFYGHAPSLPQGVTSAGLADLTGLSAAISAHKSAEAEAAAEASASANAPSTPSGPASSGEGGSTSSQLSVSSASGTDLGSLIEISADYCDRTPGAVNQFTYTFEIRLSGAILASTGYDASQTRACNSISADVDDSFASGVYEVKVTVDNLTNHVSAYRYGSVVIN